MRIPSYKGKKIAVLGFGVESQETIEFLLKREARITIFDEKDETHFDAGRIRHLRTEGVVFSFGVFESMKEFDVIVRSPGIKPGIQPLHEAGDLGIEITSATNIFFDHAKGTIIGITGTKGKGTTSALLYEILKEAGSDVYLGGNIGIPALSFVDNLRDTSVSILELSSFQLMDVQKSPHIAVILMITQDHLDYHMNTVEYVTAKMGIIRHQTGRDFTVVNADYPSSMRIADQSEAQKIFVSARHAVAHGCFIEDGMIVWAGRAVKETVCAAHDVLIPGKHNWENVCAAVAVAKILKIPNGTIAEVLGTFRGLAHRLQLIREIGGVTYYNDSISTTPDSAIAAVRAFDNPEILILGGSSKNSDFTELGKVISEAPNIKAIIGIGAEWPKIKSKIKNDRIQLVEDLGNMPDIVEKTHSLAAPGDVVILSPACASFDMFKDYKDRGDQFVKTVEGL